MTPPRPQGVILCADDFALTEGVSEGILRLAEQGRLSAIGCMTASPLWRSLAGRLDGVESRCDIGLHLSEWDEHDPARTAATVYLYVSDADALHAEWAASGVEGRLDEVCETARGCVAGDHA